MREVCRRAKWEDERREQISGPDRRTSVSLLKFAGCCCCLLAAGFLCLHAAWVY